MPGRARFQRRRELLTRVGALAAGAVLFAAVLLVAGLSRGEPPGHSAPPAAGALAQNEPEGGDLLDQFSPTPTLSEAPAPNSDSGDLLDQFGETPAAPAAPAEPAPGSKPGWATLHGSISVNGAYNYAEQPPVPQRGVSRLRPLLRLDLNLRPGGSWEAQVSGIAFHDCAYELRGRGQFTDQVLDAYEEEAEFRELYVRGTPLESLDLKFGRQIVVWGFADLIRVVDILNPVENREPGLTDIEDARLPIAMSRVDYYFGGFSATAVAVHEIAFNKDPVYGSDFYPYDQPIHDRVPTSTGAQTEYGAALTGIFEGFDVALYWADFYDDNAHLVWSGAPMLSPLEGRHSRLTMTGAAFNVALGNWLLKGESAIFRGFEYVNLPGETKRRWDNLAGVDYTGFTDVKITVEAVDRHILDFEPVMKQFPDAASEDLNQYALSCTEDFWHQTLHLTGVVLLFGDRADDGGVQRYQLAYDVFDAFTVTGGVLIFQSHGSGNPLFQRVRNNDRVFFDVKYSF